MALKCTKTSSPPSWVMKPKPFASLNHLTVPCAMFCILLLLPSDAYAPDVPEEPPRGGPPLVSRSRTLRWCRRYAGVCTSVARRGCQKGVVPRDRVTQMPLDRTQLVLLLGRSKTRGLPARLSASGAPDPVDVVLRRMR